MKINTTGRKCTLKPAFLNSVEEKLGKLVKFFPEEVQAHVTVTVEKDWQTVEITIKDRYASFRSEKSAPKMEVALEAAVEKLESMIVKNKNKISRKHKGNNYKYEELPVLPVGEEEEEEARKPLFRFGKKKEVEEEAEAIEEEMEETLQEVQPVKSSKPVAS